MIVYRGTPDPSPLIKAGSYVSLRLERAAKYARYPSNGEGVATGFIHRLDVSDSDVEWDEREDCQQGRLKRDVMAGHFAVSDLPLDLTKRQSPVRISMSNNDCVWHTGEPIRWETATGSRV